MYACRLASLGGALQGGRPTAACRRWALPLSTLVCSGAAPACAGAPCSNCCKRGQQGRRQKGKGGTIYRAARGQQCRDMAGCLSCSGSVSGRRLAGGRERGGGAARRAASARRRCAENCRVEGRRWGGRRRPQCYRGAVRAGEAHAAAAEPEAPSGASAERSAASRISAWRWPLSSAAVEMEAAGAAAGTAATPSAADASPPWRACGGMRHGCFHGCLRTWASSFSASMRVCQALMSSTSHCRAACSGADAGRGSPGGWVGGMRVAPGARAAAAAKSAGQRRRLLGARLQPALTSSCCTPSSVWPSSSATRPASTLRGSEWRAVSGGQRIGSMSSWMTKGGRARPRQQQGCTAGLRLQPQPRLLNPAARPAAQPASQRAALHSLVDQAVRRQLCCAPEGGQSVRFLARAERGAVHEAHQRADHIVDLSHLIVPAAGGTRVRRERREAERAGAGCRLQHSRRQAVRQLQAAAWRGGGGAAHAPGQG